MTRDEAISLIQQFLSHYEITNSPGLNKNNLGGTDLGAAPLYFEYKPDQAALICSGLIYRFSKLPNPKVLSALKVAESTNDTGGGSFDYQTENQCTLLSRRYDKLPDNEVFFKEMQDLVAASLVWSTEVLPKAFDSTLTP